MIKFDDGDDYLGFEQHLISATSKVREELTVSLISGEERQTNTFEVKMAMANVDVDDIE